MHMAFVLGTDAGGGWFSHDSECGGSFWYWRKDSKGVKLSNHRTILALFREFTLIRIACISSVPEMLRTGATAPRKSTTTCPCTLVVRIICCQTVVAANSWLKDIFFRWSSTNYMRIVRSSMLLSKSDRPITVRNSIFGFEGPPMQHIHSSLYSKIKVS